MQRVHTVNTYHLYHMIRGMKQKIDDLDVQYSYPAHHNDGPNSLHTNDIYSNVLRLAYAIYDRHGSNAVQYSLVHAYHSMMRMKKKMMMCCLYNLYNSHSRLVVQ